MPPNTFLSLFLSFFISSLVSPLLPTHCRWRWVLLYLITLNDTHTHTHGRTPPEEVLARRRDLYQTTHNTHKKTHSCRRQDSNPQSHQTYVLDSTATGDSWNFTKRKFLSISNKTIRKLFNNDFLTADVTYYRPQDIMSNYQVRNRKTEALACLTVRST